ncbi:MAG: hypothetical protein Phog2KO_35370 [Phototrophicaceae bacterium]
MDRNVKTSLRKDSLMSDNINANRNIDKENTVLPFKDGDAIPQDTEQNDDDAVDTLKMPYLEDEEDDSLHIGSVRFRGHLILTEKDTGKVHRIENKQLDEALIGRENLRSGFTPLIDFTNTEGKELGVSRRHATITQRGDLIFVTDHNSLNGTYLNGHRLVPEQARLMRDSDALRVGYVTLFVSFEDVVDDN